MSRYFTRLASRTGLAVSGTTGAVAGLHHYRQTAAPERNTVDSDIEVHEEIAAAPTQSVSLQSLHSRAEPPVSPAQEKNITSGDAEVSAPTTRLDRFSRATDPAATDKRSAATGQSTEVAHAVTVETVAPEIAEVVRRNSPEPSPKYREIPQDAVPQNIVDAGPAAHREQTPSANRLFHTRQPVPEHNPSGVRNEGQPEQYGEAAPLVTANVPPPTTAGSPERINRNGQPNPVGREVLHDVPAEEAAVTGVHTRKTAVREISMDAPIPAGGITQAVPVQFPALPKQNRIDIRIGKIELEVHQADVAVPRPVTGLQPTPQTARGNNLSRYYLRGQ